MEDKKEECGVFGISSDSEVCDSIYYGLYSLQHRGQESAGIATYTDRVNVFKDMGLVSDVFRDGYLKGKVGIGHVRYSTTGGSKIENAQPILIKYSGGSFAIAHNGNIVNSSALRKELTDEGETFATTTDSEVIAKIISREHLKKGEFIEGLKSAMNYFEGSYCILILRKNMIIAVRDPQGFKPLVLGKCENGWAVSSESCAFDAIGIKLVRDVKPSEIIKIHEEEISSDFGPEKKISKCMFEYIYFARPDSVIDGRSVYEIRKECGKVMAKEAPVQADYVAAVPSSGISAAIGYAEESGIHYNECLIWNKYIGRTFISPEKSKREISVKLKLNPIRDEIEGKRIILVDDSIVRGTTIKRLIKVFREYGAREIHLRIACPPLKFPCFYGIDMQSKGEFIAAKKTLPEIAKELGVDSLAYLSMDGMINAIGLPKNELCLACLNGDYPTELFDQEK